MHPLHVKLMTLCMTFYITSCNMISHASCHILNVIRRQFQPLTVYAQLYMSPMVHLSRPISAHWRDLFCEPKSSKRSHSLRRHHNIAHIVYLPFLGSYCIAVASHSSKSSCHSWAGVYIISTSLGKVPCAAAERQSSIATRSPIAWDSAVKILFRTLFIRLFPNSAVVMTPEHVRWPPNFRIRIRFVEVN